MSVTHSCGSLLLKHGLRSREARQRDPVGAATYVVESGAVAELHARGLTAVFSANTQFDFRLDRTRFTYRQGNELTNSSLVELLKTGWSFSTSWRR